MCVCNQVGVICIGCLRKDPSPDNSWPSNGDEALEWWSRVAFLKWQLIPSISTEFQDVSRPGDLCFWSISSILSISSSEAQVLCCTLTKISQGHGSIAKHSRAMEVTNCV